MRLPYQEFVLTGVIWIQRALKWTEIVFALLVISFEVNFLLLE